MDMIGFVLDNLYLLIFLIDIILMITMLFWERNDPKSTVIWILVLWILPLFGFILYLFLGQTFYSTRTFRHKATEDERLAEVLKIEKMIMEQELKGHPENAEKLNFANTIQNAGGVLYTNMNDVTLLPESKKYFDSLLEDLRNAKETINFEYYIIRNDRISNELMNILIDKVKSGVEVRLMIDAIGNNKGPKKNIMKFKKAGGEYSLFHSTWTCLLSPRKNNRNHRKIAIIDGRIGYVGGYNIGDEYLGEGPLGYWRDCAVRVNGTAVASMQFRFLADWRYATKKDLVLEDRFYKYDTCAGDTSMQLISGGPDVSENNPIQMQYLNIVTNAKKTLYIQTPYLEPDQALADCVRRAAFAGVDVRIIMPNIGDHPFVYWANRYWASVFLRAGVKVYEYNRGFIHAKTLVGDGYYCSVGSANFDDRSMKLNFETNVMIYSEKIGKEMNDTFLEDLEYCTEYTLEMYHNRTTWQRFKTGVSRLVSGQL